MAPDHPAANQRGWLPRRVVINPLNRSMKDLCCHQDIYRPDSRFRNQSDTSVQSKGWLHFNFYPSEHCSAGKCSNHQGGNGTFEKKGFKHGHGGRRGSIECSWWIFETIELHCVAWLIEESQSCTCHWILTAIKYHSCSPAPLSCTPNLLEPSMYMKQLSFQ